jgi:hypothetical protein
MPPALGAVPPRAIAPRGFTAAVAAAARLSPDRAAQPWGMGMAAAGASGEGSGMRPAPAFAAQPLGGGGALAARPPALAAPAAAAVAAAPLTSAGRPARITRRPIVEGVSIYGDELPAEGEALESSIGVRAVSPPAPAAEPPRAASPPPPPPPPPPAAAALSPLSPPPSAQSPEEETRDSALLQSLRESIALTDELLRSPSPLVAGGGAGGGGGGARSRSPSPAPALLRLENAAGTPTPTTASPLPPPVPISISANEAATLTSPGAFFPSGEGAAGRAGPPRGGKEGGSGAAPAAAPADATGDGIPDLDEALQSLAAVQLKVNRRLAVATPAPPTRGGGAAAADAIAAPAGGGQGGAPAPSLPLTTPARSWTPFSRGGTMTAAKTPKRSEMRGGAPLASARSVRSAARANGQP